MPDRSTVIYRYDGSYQGFLCCVAQCFQDKALPVSIRPYDEEQQSLYGSKDIPTRFELAQRVERSIPRRFPPRPCAWCGRGSSPRCRSGDGPAALFAAGLQIRAPRNPDDHPPRGARLGEGRAGPEQRGPPCAGVLRFADCGEFLAAKIQPQGKVLPLVAPHFCDRLPSESFMIYDSAHGMGFLHRADTPGEFFQADQVELPSPSQAELRWQNLWKVFYRTIAVEGRENPQLRRQLCPKRYWPLMTELGDAS